MRKNSLIISVLILFLLGIKVSFGQCDVNIGTDRTICYGTEITLSASGDGVFYQWNNGSTGDEIVVSPIVETEYIVTATCQDGSTDTDTIIVYVNELPNVNLGDDIEICLNESTNLSITGGLNYLWSNNSLEESITVSPTTTTDYWVIITDFNNCQNSDTITVFVNPLPTLTTSSDQEICMGQSTTITITTGAPIYFWNTGAENASTIVAPIETSTYVATVENEFGCTNTDTTTVTVNTNPTSDFSFTESCQLELSSFNDNSYDNQNQIVAWNWDFDDGNQTNEQNPNHLFSNSGVFDVSLIVTSDKNCKDTTIKSVEVFIKPEANFTVSSEYSCNVPVSIDFDNLSSNSISWSWDFGNNEISTDEYPETIYENIGEYQIELIVESNKGCIDTMYNTFNVYQKPNVNFSADFVEGCEPINISFFNNSNDYDSSIWYIDNQMFFTNDVNHEFYGEGLYDVTLTVLNEHCSALVTKENFIEVFNKPEPDFSWQEETNPFPYGLVYFSNYTTDANSYLWSFGDTINSSDLEPEHRYETYGDFLVTQIAFDTLSGCSDTIEKTITIEYFDGLYVPNAFIPEAGIGDERFFLPKGKHMKDYHIWIFNNSGNLMWESTLLDFGSPAEGWDGSYNGSPMPQGVYFWKIEATFENDIKWKGQKQDNGKIKSNGYLTLIR